MSKATLERNTFVKGLITEANPLTFPENASIDEDNFVLNRDGSRQRRNGMDYENDYALVSTGYADSNFSSVAISSFLWKNVGEDPTLTVAVIQVGRTLHFLDAGTANPSDNELGTLTLSAIYDNSPFQYTAIKGVLILVNEADESGPAYISYDGSTFSRTAYEIAVRDIWGVYDGLYMDERPSTLSITHQYNLMNQGWANTVDGPPEGDSWEAVAAKITNREPSTAIEAVGYPSNSDIYHLGKNSSDDFDASLLRKQQFGNTPAAKGSIVLDAFNRGVSRTSSTTLTVSGELPEDIENGRLVTVATYSGRVFYAGVASDVTGGDSVSPNYTGTIFFTRVVDSLSRLGNCYQEADPTSEHISDLLPTDGGTIEIPEASRIHKLISKGTSLVAFAENGVWEITGRDGVFAADDFFVRRVTSVGSIGPGSVVNVEESVMYWSEGGIYVLSPNDQDVLVAQNLSESTIQTFYTDIPAVGRLYAKGNYDPISKKVSWLYNNINNYETNQINNYNKELILDTVLGSFYTSSIGELETDSPYVAGYIQVTEYLSQDRVDNVVVNGVPVTVNGEQVVVTTQTRSSGTGVTKYLTIVPDATDNKLTLSYYNNTDFLDWYTADSTGVDAPAYLVTGYELFADSQRRKYIPYLTMHFKRTETGFTNSGGSLVPVGASSCLVQAQWDFANSANSGKWGTPFQTYRLTRAYMPVDVNDTFDYGHAVITTKSRVRGSGRAFSMKLYTEAGKDCHIYGWAMLAEGGSGV